MRRHAARPLGAGGRIASRPSSATSAPPRPTAHPRLSRLATAVARQRCLRARWTGRTRLRLKVEINTREHFAVFGFTRRPFSVASRWYSGTAAIATSELDELLATKLRALYQRRKGRDLFEPATGLADERSYVEISGRDHAELVTDDRAALREPLEAGSGERRSRRSETRGRSHWRPERPENWMRRAQGNGVRVGRCRRRGSPGASIGTWAFEFRAGGTAGKGVRNARMAARLGALQLIGSALYISI